MTDNVLLQRFLNEFPEAFLKTLLGRQLAIYRESISQAFNDPPWARIDAFSVLPALRRARMESAFRDAAISCGLKVSDQMHFGQNCSCVHVRSGNMIVTEHFVAHPQDFVREARSRKQNAGANKWLSHYTDTRLLLQPPPSLSNKPIYLNLLHGGDFPTPRSNDLSIDGTTCFLQVAVPDADANQYLPGCNWSAIEILAHYAEIKRNDSEPQVEVKDNVLPRIKRSKEA